MLWIELFFILTRQVNVMKQSQTEFAIHLTKFVLDLLQKTVAINSSSLRRVVYDTQRGRYKLH